MKMTNANSMIAKKNVKIRKHLGNPMVNFQRLSYMIIIITFQTEYIMLYT